MTEVVLGAVVVVLLIQAGIISWVALKAFQVRRVFSGKGK